MLSVPLIINLSSSPRHCISVSPGNALDVLVPRGPEQPDVFLRSLQQEDLCALGPYLHIKGPQVSPRQRAVQSFLTSFAPSTPTPGGPPAPVPVAIRTLHTLAKNRFEKLGVGVYGYSSDLYQGMFGAQVKRWTRKAVIASFFTCRNLTCVIYRRHLVNWRPRRKTTRAIRGVVFWICRVPVV